MAVYIHKSKVSGNINVPPSKSLSHRALLASLLAEGETKIYNLLDCEDTRATISIMEKLGKSVVKKEGYHLVQNNGFKYNNEVLNANESGSTLRFIIPILSLFTGKHYITGTKKLLSRPLQVYQEIYDKQNLKFNLTPEMLEVDGKLSSGKYSVRGDVSSQFITGLMYTLPLLNGDSIIEITGNYESKSYVDLTIEVLKHFSVEIKQLENNCYFVKGSQKYISKDYYVPGDYSQMAFWAVLGTINNNLTISGMNAESLQGDKMIVDILSSCSNNIEFCNGIYNVKKANVKKLDIDLAEIPDLGPILGVLCSVSCEKSRLFNAYRLRYKESDRLTAIYEELSKMNVKAKIVDDSLIIESSNEIKCLEEIDSHNDHRIFMALAVLGTISENGVRINDERCINKSYPDFLKDLQGLGVQVDYE